MGGLAWRRSVLLVELESGADGLNTDLMMFQILLRCVVPETSLSLARYCGFRPAGANWRVSKRLLLFGRPL